MSKIMEQNACLRYFLKKTSVGQEKAHDKFDIFIPAKLLEKTANKPADDKAHQS